MNVFFPIWRNAQAFPGRAALVVDGTEVSYRNLARMVATTAGRLAQAGLVQGDVVALSIRRPGAYLLAALAVARLGGIVTPFNTGWPSAQASAVLERHKVRLMVTESEDGWRHPLLPEGRYLTVKDAMAPAAAGKSLAIPAIATELGTQPWIFALSSGTTGTPKSIPQTHDRAILTACLPTTVSPTADMSRVLVFASPNLSMTMNAMLYQLIGGRTLILASVMTAESFFAIAHRDQPTHVKTSAGNVNGLVHYAAQSLPDSRERCRSIRGMNIAGSAASATLRAKIEQYICPHLEVNYGGSEVGRVAQATAETLVARPQSAGRLRHWVEMEAVDDDDQPLPPGQPGVLRVRSPLLVSGYLGDPQATARAFRHGWFYPGDTGHVDEAGYLTLTGRVDDVLNLGGNKVDPFTIEAVLDAQPGVRESAVVAVTTRQGAAVLVAVVVTTGPVDEAGLKKACAASLGPYCVPARIVSAKSIARNAGGKIMRKEIATRLAANMAAV